jgi:hypothetical protein
MLLTNRGKHKLRSAFCWMTIILGAFAYGLSADAQQEAPVAQAMQISIRTGLLEVSARNQADTRLISVRLQNRLLAEFKADIGEVLDFLATYADIDATYVVLRTNMGQGACVGTDVFVLKVLENEDGKNAPRADISPILRKCMGEGPEVKFTHPGAETIVTVAGYQLRNKKWVPDKH